jgi:hypothetical protein
VAIRRAQQPPGDVEDRLSGCLAGSDNVAAEEAHVEVAEGHAQATAKRRSTQAAGALQLSGAAAAAVVVSAAAIRSLSVRYMLRRRSSFEGK